MIVFGLIVAGAVASGVARAQEPVNVEAFIKKCADARPPAVADAKADLEASKAELTEAQQGTVNRQASQPMKLANG